MRRLGECVAGLFSRDTVQLAAAGHQAAGGCRACSAQSDRLAQSGLAYSRGSYSIRLLHHTSSHYLCVSQCHRKCIHKSHHHVIPNHRLDVMCHVLLATRASRSNSSCVPDPQLQNLIAISSRTKHQIHVVE